MMENNDHLSRRRFLKNSLMVAALPLGPLQTLTDSNEAIEASDSVALRWLETKLPPFATGTTWGVPWRRGIKKTSTSFTLEDEQGRQIAMQTWPLAFWPDGSLKWTAHAVGKQDHIPSAFRLKTGKNEISEKKLSVTEGPGLIKIDTGVMQLEVATEGSMLIRSVSRQGKIVAMDGKLVVNTLDSTEENEIIRQQSFESIIDKVTIEQRGPVRGVVKVEGKHLNSEGRRWLPFIVRFYLYVNSEAIRIMHTFIFDGDEKKDFIKGVGMSLSMPLSAPLHDRHVRFTADESGVFAEAVRGLTGLRRDPGDEITNAQTSGKATPLVSAFPPQVAKRLDYIPAFGDYTLFQPTPDSFEIQKRTKRGHGWIQSAYGKRSSGMAFLGTPDGGLAFGIRNFWQSHPAQLDIRNAHTERADLTMWLWAPKSAAMDLRFYHDGMGQDTYEKQLEGLEITYEDYEPGFGSPVGIARTSELQLFALPATPSNRELADIASVVQNPPVISFTPAYWQETGVLGSAWNVPYTASPRKEELRKQLDWYFDHYQQQVDQHRWYGFWNYGDVMHSYDNDRHMWRYDVGGFAWDNSELSTDIWLWQYFLYSGRPEAFRMAEAMTRHTGEVDVHHLGPFSPFGSRHNVQHWGCSAKQLRISTVENRRFYYYLTGDERVGDLMREQVNAERALRNIVPGRKVGQKAAEADGYASVSFGTDWGALAAAWFTEWERTGDKHVRDKLLNSMRTIALQPHGFFTGGAEMELATGKFVMQNKEKITASHLSAVFGLAEICMELVDVVKMPEFEKAWLQYCQLYNATPEEQTAALGKSLGKLNLQQGHSRLTAFAAVKMKDPNLTKRAWKEFFDGGAGIRNPSGTVRIVEPPMVLNRITEAQISTNAVAQWGLSAMTLIALLGDRLEQ